METTIIAGLTIVAAAYARRRFAPAWRSFKAEVEAAVARAEAKAKAEAAGDYPGGFQNTMTTKEASLILGIGESSAKDKVKEAHRRAIFKNHPDAGGSAYLASKINQAKDILMKNTENR